MSPSVSISAKDVEEVLATFDREGLLEAVLLVHRCLDLGLSDITDAVEPLLRHTGRHVGSKGSGVAAEVLATGIFRHELAAHMDYGEKQHATTRDGTRVIVSFVNVGLRAFQAEVLARCMGAEAWDFNTHALVPERVRIEDLASLLMDDELVTRFHALRNAGFRFHFHLRSLSW
ncbi:hypothetical protein D7V80_12535 [Corallococcus sp. CA054B]|uniref:hypothetical protein n=1 Tax=Corallococcus sp. CA054B TaxID=2316734 RepID=UPI000EA01A02|nr:hypothetical protein [Corallococcus sp. CA054B]RKG68448.1 hypothetical protein D7V80_12535 [Corallococcus sp. CA054B]